MSLCCVCQMTYEGLVGNPKNRWFDKTTPTIVFENGFMSSSNDVSHSTDFTELICAGWAVKTMFSVHPVIETFYDKME